MSKISKTLALLTKFYLNNRNTISLNKDLVLSGIVGFVISLFVAYYSNIYSADKILNSALTVLAGFISSKVIFVILFHLDNKEKYTKRFTGKLNFEILKQIVTKMIFADAIFDIINNVSRFFILLELFKNRISASTSCNNSIHYSLMFILFSYKFRCKTHTCI